MSRMLISCDCDRRMTSGSDSPVPGEALDDPQALKDTHVALQLFRALLDLSVCGHTLQENISEHAVAILNHSTQPERETERERERGLHIASFQRTSEKNTRDF